MSDPVAMATERLADALLDAILAALKANAFYPSDRFIEELREVIHNNIGLGQ